MDQGLFGKYLVTIRKRENEQNEIISFIKENSGVELLPNEIVLKKKNLSFQTSSVKKMVLQSKKIDILLQEKGYYVKF